MDKLPGLRVLGGFAVDGSLAVLCGLLLASRWSGRRVGGRGWFAGVLLSGAGAQLWLLAVTLSDQGSVWAMLPDVCGTHAGGVLVGLCVTAAVLCGASLAGAGDAWAGVLVVASLLLHGSAGHATVDGIWSVTQGLQWVHLLAMGVWSGGVVVSGLWVAPRLVEAREYVGRLSTASTWAVGLVVASGVMKAYRVTDGSLAALRTSHWGALLVVKGVLVAVALGLGGRNRWLLRRGMNGKVLAWTLRWEAVAMVGVLLMSAWLGGTAPPGE